MLCPFRFASHKILLRNFSLTNHSIFISSLFPKEFELHHSKLFIKIYPKVTIANLWALCHFIIEKRAFQPHTGQFQEMPQNAFILWDEGDKFWNNYQLQNQTDNDFFLSTSHCPPQMHQPGQLGMAGGFCRIGKGMDRRQWLRSLGSGIRINVYEMIAYGTHR